MLFLTGEGKGKPLIEFCRKHGWGRIFIEKKPEPYPGEPWGFDNGAYMAYSRNLDFNKEKYLYRLNRAYDVGRPYLAVVPDIVGGGLESLNYSLQWVKELPQDWPWYLALQDGMNVGDVSKVVDRFSGLFLGGTDKFKGTAFFWKALAGQHGKPFHYGRAGTLKKIRHAQEIGADSADSAFPLWTKDRLYQTLEILNSRNEQPRLFPADVWSVVP